MLFYVKSNERLSGKVTFEIRPKGSKGISCGEAGGGVYGKISVFSVQFCWEPTTVLKNKVKKEGRKEGRKGRKANKKKEKKKTKQASRGKELRVQERPAADHIISVPGSIRSRKNCGCFR